jgi:hypothetical protein
LGGAEGPVGEPGDRRTATRGMRGPLRDQVRRPSRAIREAIRPRLVVVEVGVPPPGTLVHGSAWPGRSANFGSRGF